MLKYSLVILQAEQHSKQHVQNAESDGQFHFVSVEEDDFVFGKLQQTCES